MWSRPRIAVQLARYSVAVAIGLSSAILSLLVVSDYRREQARSDELATVILQVGAADASQAVVNADYDLAGALADELLRHEFVVAVRVSGNRGSFLVERTLDRAPEATSWVSLIIRDLEIDREVELVDGRSGNRVGTLTMTQSRLIAMRDFYERSIIATALIFSGILIFFVTLSVIFHRFLTQPLSEFTDRLLRFGADDPKPINGTVSPGIADNEFGKLVRAINQVLQSNRTAMQEARDSQSDLAQREAQFRDFAAAASDWFWETDAQNRVVFVSRRFSDMTGMSAEAMIGLTISGFHDRKARNSEDVADFGMELLHTAMESRSKFRDLPGVIDSPNGQMHVSCSGLPIFSKDGTFQGYRGVTRDRSDLVASEAERQRLADTLAHAQKLQAIGQLTGGVAHDFNNLLAVIQGNLELAEADHPKGDRVSELLRGALEATDRGAALTHRLLAYARKQPLLPEIVETGDMLNEFKEVLRRTLGEAIEIEMQMSGELWRCVADRHQLEIVLLNLGINARDAMPEGGRLTIEAFNTRLDGEVWRESMDVKPGQYVCFSVTDTGVGMPPEVATQAFDPFFTTKPAGQGSGLGLSMAFGFAKQSGGHIRLSSDPGIGTRVDLFLPRSTEAKLRPLPPPKLTALRTGEAIKIMVVEDERAVLDVVTAHLQSLGYSVVGAGDAKQAVELCKKHPDLQLFLLDVVLPGGQSGRGLAQHLGELRPDAKMLFMSGYAADVVTDRSWPEPGVVLLQKPFSRAQLSLAIADTLEDETNLVAG